MARAPRTDLMSKTVQQGKYCPYCRRHGLRWHFASCALFTFSKEN